MTVPRGLPPPPELDWSANDAFAHSVLVLLESLDEAAVERLEQNLCVIHTLKRTFVLLRYVPQLREKLAQVVSALVSDKRPGPILELALIGGPKAASGLIERSRPQRPSLRIFHLTEPEQGTLGEPYSLLGHGPSPLGSALSQAKQKTGTEIDTMRARSLAEAGRARFVERAREEHAFAQLLGARKPIATYAIMGLIGMTFLLQLLPTSANTTEKLIEMGALSRPHVLEGEWWRLASATLLHGGLMHVAFNTYVLYALGSLVERLIGPARFLILYVLSGVAASMGSLMLGAGLSVGASGAIWGLLGAEAALAFGPNQLLPTTIRQNAKRATVVNLVLNTVVSFLPRVDWAAHFVGGAAGALLVVSGLLLPAPDKPGAFSASVWNAAALLLSVAFFGAGAYGVLRGAL